MIEKRRWQWTLGLTPCQCGVLVTTCTTEHWMISFVNKARGKDPEPATSLPVVGKKRVVHFNY